jgi:hypothetical protein
MILKIALLVFVPLLFYTIAVRTHVRGSPDAVWRALRPDAILN